MSKSNDRYVGVTDGKEIEGVDVGPVVGASAVGWIDGSVKVGA